MEFYTNFFTINWNHALLSFCVSVYCIILPQAYALNYDNYGEDDDFGEENIDQTLQQDDISNTPQSSSDMPTAGVIWIHLKALKSSHCVLMMVIKDN